MGPGDRQIDRRDLLKGRIAAGAGVAEAGTAQAVPPRFFHVSSAVVTARPEHCPDLAREIAALPKTEIHAIEGSKIVLVMEGESSGEIGSRLTTIALMDGVFSANLVFEQIEAIDDPGAKT